MDYGSTVLTVPGQPVEPSGASSFSERFDELFDLAYRVAYRILGRQEDAKDVAQEALARAEVRWSRLADAPHGWVAKVAGNLAIGVWRKGRHPAPQSAEAAADPDDRAAERVDLIRALDHLPRRQRQVVILRYLADRPEAAVARLLGCSVGAVKTHASRGLRAMRAELGGA